MLPISLMLVGLSVLLASAGTQTLTPTTPIERELRPGDTHTHAIELEPNQFVHLEVVSRRINVVVRLTHPTGQQWMTFDYGDEATPETMMFVTDAGGRYAIEVFSAPDVPAGRYTIRVEALRAATDRDAGRVAARRTLEEGIRAIPASPPSGWSPLIDTFQAARAGFRDAGDRPGEARALYQLSFVAENTRRPEARQWADDALALYRELGDANGSGKALFEIATLHDRAGEMPQARAAFMQAAELFREAENRTWEASALNGLGIVYGKTGETERAIEQFVQALDRARVIKAARVESSSLTNLGIATKNVGDYRGSITYYEQALALARASGDVALEANALNNLGNLYRLLEQHDKALSSHTDALALARKVKSQDDEARALNALGSTYARLGDHPKALEYQEQSLAIRRTLNAPAALAASLQAIGRTSQRLGKEDRALEYLSEALRLSQTIGDPLLESSTLENLAMVERDRANLHAALEYITASVELTDTLRSRVVSPDLRATFVASAQEQYELHTDILMQLHRQRPEGGFDRRALEASERGRARVLLESLLEARTDIRQGVDPALLEQERTAQRQIDTASASLSRLLSRQSDAKEIAAARAKLEQLNTDARALGVRIRQQSPAYAALTQPPSITTREIQDELLDGNTILLEYALGDRRSWVWAVTRSGLTSVELPPRREIERGARDLYAALTARRDEDARKKASALGRVLLGPVSMQLGDAWRGKRLLIVAPDALQYVPFAALIDPVGGKLPMVASHEIVSLPSAAVLAAIRRDAQERPAPRGEIAVFADPVFDAGDPRIAKNAARPQDKAPAALTRAINSMDAMGTKPPSRLSRLPFSRDEARAITALVPADRRMQAIDFDASRATAMSADLSGYRIVHFATHGFLNTEQPELSGLVLSLVDRDGRAQDGFLRMNDIYNLRLPADVIVLSACQTALGKAIRGEGLVGLTRGFMYAGARRVVASLWQVDDLATAELMRIFYRGMLKDRLSPAAALRAAQRELSRDPRWASPYYWSAFVLQGEWR